MFHLFSDSITSAGIVGIFIVGFIAGWAAEFIMGRAGYGVVMNSFVIMAGIVGGLLGLAYFGHRVDDNIILTMAAAAGGGAGLLIFLAILRKL